MAVRVARGAKSHWRSGRLQFRIESPADPAEVHAAVARIADRLYDLDDDEGGGPVFVSEPVPLEDGLVFWLDARDAAPTMIDRIVATVVSGLEADDIDVRLSAGGAGLPPTDLYDLTIAAFGVLPHPGVRNASAVLPRAEVDAALSWVTEWAEGDVEIISGGAALGLPAVAAEAVARRWLGEGRSVMMLGDRAGTRRGCCVVHPSGRDRNGSLPHIAVQLTGPEVTAAWDSTFESMVQRARAFGDAMPWRFVDLAFRGGVRPPRPYWSYDPSGPDAAVALADRVLDVRPWQLLLPAQVERLPDLTDAPGLFDAATGELRLGRPAAWLDAARVRPRFEPTLRSLLGPALATRDVTWEAVQRLPSSDPRPSGEPEVEIHPADLSEVTLVSHAHGSPHPTIGVTPLDLFVLRRGEPLGESFPRASTPVLTWLGAIAGVPAEDHARLRAGVEVLAAGDTEPRWAQRHRRILVSWLARALAPDLLAIAGLGGADELRAAVSSDLGGDITESAKAVVQVLVAVSDEAAMSPWNPSSASDELSVRRAVVIGGAARRAATSRHGGGFGEALMDRALHDLVVGRGSIDPRAIRRLWLEGGMSETEALFRLARERAGLLHPQLTGAWERAWRYPMRKFYDALAVALLLDRHGEGAWDRAIEAGRDKVSHQWPEVEDRLHALPEAERAEMWAEGDDIVSTMLGQVQFSVGAMLVALPAAHICTLAATVAHERGRDRELADVVWSAVDVLVDLIARHQLLPA